MGDSDKQLAELAAHVSSVAEVRDLLTRNLPKAYAGLAMQRDGRCPVTCSGDPKELQEVMRSRFNVEVASIVDIRTGMSQVPRPLETMRPTSSFDLCCVQLWPCLQAPGFQYWPI